MEVGDGYIEAAAEYYLSKRGPIGRANRLKRNKARGEDWGRGGGNLQDVRIKRYRSRMVGSNAGEVGYQEESRRLRRAAQQGDPGARQEVQGRIKFRRKEGRLPYRYNRGGLRMMEMMAGVRKRGRLDKADMDVLKKLPRALRRIGTDATDAPYERFGDYGVNRALAASYGREARSRGEGR